MNVFANNLNKMIYLCVTDLNKIIYPEEPLDSILIVIMTQASKVEIIASSVCYSVCQKYPF